MKHKTAPFIKISILWNLRGPHYKPGASLPVRMRHNQFRDLILVNRPFVDRIPCSRSEPCNWPRKNSTVETSLIPRQNKFLTGLKALYCSEMAFFYWSAYLITGLEPSKPVRRTINYFRGRIIDLRRCLGLAASILVCRLCSNPEALYTDQTPACFGQKFS